MPGYNNPMISEISAPMKQYYFSETQYFRQFWVWGLVILCFGLVLMGTILAIEHNALMKTWGLIILDCLFYIIPVFILLVLASMKLETQIDADGIYYRLFPIHLRERMINWPEIDTIFIRKYKPLLEYGGFGWGNSLRFGRAYNISGSWGIQIVFNDGRKLLLGTQKYIELEDLFHQLSKAGFVKNIPVSPNY